MFSEIIEVLLEEKIMGGQNGKWCSKSRNYNFLAVLESRYQFRNGKSPEESQMLIEF